MRMTSVIKIPWKTASKNKLCRNKNLPVILYMTGFFIRETQISGVFELKFVSRIPLLAGPKAEGFIPVIKMIRVILTERKEQKKFVEFGQAILNAQDLFIGTNLHSVRQCGFSK